jgi:hypothetical protein
MGPFFAGDTRSITAQFRAHMFWVISYDFLFLLEICSCVLHSSIGILKYSNILFRGKKCLVDTF